MDAKQVWRAALGELQVTLSPANFETWLRDTALVEVDDTRFRISVPNGFAKDWMESRYRSLISQTLAAGKVIGKDNGATDFIANATGGIFAAGWTPQLQEMVGGQQTGAGMLKAVQSEYEKELAG